MNWLNKTHASLTLPAMFPLTKRTVSSRRDVHYPEAHMLSQPMKSPLPSLVSINGILGYLWVAFTSEQTFPFEYTCDRELLKKLSSKIPGVWEDLWHHCPATCSSGAIQHPSIKVGAWLYVCGFTLAITPPGHVCYARSLVACSQHSSSNIRRMRPRFKILTICAICQSVQFNPTHF